MGLVCGLGPVRPASAQIPPVPGPLSDLLANLTTAVSGLLNVGPNVFVDLDTTQAAKILPGNYGSELMRVNGIIVNCSGVFLPVKGLDGPVNLDVTVTQTIDGVVTIGHQRTTTPPCDGTDHEGSADVAVSGGSQLGFLTGTAVVSLDFYACDVTGCNQWSTAGNVFVE